MCVWEICADLWMFILWPFPDNIWQLEQTPQVLVCFHVWSGPIPTSCLVQATFQWEPLDTQEQAFTVDLVWASSDSRPRRESLCWLGAFRSKQSPVFTHSVHCIFFSSCLAPWLNKIRWPTWNGARKKLNHKSQAVASPNECINTCCAHSNALPINDGWRI